MSSADACCYTSTPKPPTSFAASLCPPPPRGAAAAMVVDDDGMGSVPKLNLNLVHSDEFFLAAPLKLNNHQHNDEEDGDENLQAFRIPIVTLKPRRLSFGMNLPPVVKLQPRPVKLSIRQEDVSPPRNHHSLSMQGASVSSLA
jgi:hypothetical protein